MLLALLFLIPLQGSLAAGSDDSGKIWPYQYQMRDLDNGLRVIVIPTDYPNIVTLQIPVMTGSRNEVEAGKSGFAHFFEHMMFRGTEKYPSDKYNAVLKNAGADQNAYTTDDYTNYHTTFSKEDLETILKLEADRFQHLKYSVEDFKTESRAILGEYNKNSANPIRKIFEVQRDAAYTKHTYKHTTMGFLRDIEDMPNQYDYSLKFFDRFYRPEKTTVILAGDLEPEQTFKLVEKYWGGWKRGSYKADIPQEPAPEGPYYEHVNWDSPTAPWITVGFRGPAFSGTDIDMPTMDIISNLAFSSSSELYQKLVVKEQVADQLFAYFPDRKDPYLLTVMARLRDGKDMWYVRDEIQKAFAQLRTERVSARKLDDIKSNLKYSFAGRLDNSESIADAVVPYVALTRDPETVNRLYRRYDEVTPADLQRLARKYYTDKRMIVVSLSSDPTTETADKMGSVDAAAKELSKPAANLATLLQPSSSPLVDVRLLFNTGAMDDPAGKEGLATLTAAMVADAGSADLTYEQIQKALFPMAAGFGSQVDKEMTVFGGQVHRDNLGSWYDIVSGQLLNPGWREEDFSRVRNNLVNAIKISLRGNNDEELGKEVLYEEIYKNHPYGHLNMGHIEALEALTLDDVRAFYHDHYTRANLVVGLAGGYDDAFVQKLKKDLSNLPAGDASAQKPLPEPEAIDGMNVTIVKKNTRATAISMGFPIDVTRSDNDFAALWLVRSYFGEHRSSNSYLYQRIRKIRGMNYGDYSYIEYFPNGMYQFHPDANLGRRQQIFQIWIRPVVPEQAHFALRVAQYEMDKLVKNGMSEQDFEATRNYLLKFVHVLTKSQNRQLGYALDSRYYNIPEFTDYITQGLKSLTLDDVNRAIREHLQSKNMDIVMITKDAEGLRDALVNDTPSPITYQATPPDAILEEDQIIERYPLHISAEKVKIVPVEEVFLK